MLCIANEAFEPTEKEKTAKPGRKIGIWGLQK